MIGRMKTTLDINDALLADAKSLAARQRTTLTRVIEEGLRLRLRTPASPPAAPALIPVFEGKGGFASGLDGLDNKMLRDAADDDA